MDGQPGQDDGEGEGGGGGGGGPAPSGPMALLVDELSGPGRRCPGATGDELVGLLRAWAAIESWAAAAKLGVIREIIRREAPPSTGSDHGDLPETWSAVAALRAGRGASLLHPVRRDHRVARLAARGPAARASPPPRGRDPHQPQGPRHHRDPRAAGRPRRRRSRSPHRRPIGGKTYTQVLRRPSRRPSPSTRGWPSPRPRSTPRRTTPGSPSSASRPGPRGCPAAGTPGRGPRRHGRRQRPPSPGTYPPKPTHQTTHGLIQNPLPSRPPHKLPPLPSPRRPLTTPGPASPPPINPPASPPLTLPPHPLRLPSHTALLPLPPPPPTPLPPAEENKESDSSDETPMDPPSLLLPPPPPSPLPPPSRTLPPPTPPHLLPTAPRAPPPSTSTPPLPPPTPVLRAYASLDLHQRAPAAGARSRASIASSDAGLEGDPATTGLAPMADTAASNPEPKRYRLTAAGYRPLPRRRSTTQRGVHSYPLPRPVADSTTRNR